MRATYAVYNLSFLPHLSQSRLLYTGVLKPTRFNSSRSMSSKTTQARTALAEMAKDGAFARVDSVHRSTTVEPVAGRYHLYVSVACPWACGALQAISIKGLNDVISHSITHPTWQRTRPDNPDDSHCGWVFRKASDEPLSNSNSHGSFSCDELCGSGDQIEGCSSIRDLYELSEDTGGKYTTPVLWDKKLKKIVNNESTEILRIINKDFNELANNKSLGLVDLYPEELEEEGNRLNDIIYPNINNGVYRCGFASSQAAYELAFKDLFDALDQMEELLSKQRYLCGSKFTWIDLRLFNTLIRFDEVYAVYFKCNKKLIREYPNLFNYTKDCYQVKGMSGAISMYHIKTHYYTSHVGLNQHSVVPLGNKIDYCSAHDRARFE